MTVVPILTRPTPSLTLADQHTEKVLRKRTIQGRTLRVVVHG